MDLAFQQSDSDTEVSYLCQLFNPGPALWSKSYEFHATPTQMDARLHQSSAVLKLLTMKCLSLCFVSETQHTSVAGR